jgi:hypothetical protein
VTEKGIVNDAQSFAKSIPVPAAVAAVVSSLIPVFTAALKLAGINAIPETGGMAVDESQDVPVVKALNIMEDVTEAFEFSVTA